MLSISIVTYKSDLDLLEKSLNSIYSSVIYIRDRFKIDKIWIIDNSNLNLCTVEKISKFKKILPQLEFLKNFNNLGYGAAQNIAIRNSKSKYHLILNPDVLLAQDNLYQGLQYLEQNPDVAAISPYGQDLLGNRLYLTKNYPSIFDLFLRLLPRFPFRILCQKRCDKYDNKEIVESNSIANVYIISGCYMMCRKSHLVKAGLFDEKYFLYFEDFALSIELKKIGRLIYLPNVKIEHYGGNASRKGIKHIVHFIRSAVIFFSNYGWKIF